MTNNDSEPLQPAAYQPPTPLPEDGSESSTATRPPWILPGLVGLAVLALFVLLLLPGLVDDPSTTAVVATTNTNSSITETRSASSGPADSTDTNAPSPFAEAQLQKQRRAAQEALQRVLELQEILVELSVTQWAPEAYAAALLLAETGDGYYRERDFIPAASTYQDAGDALLAIEASIAERTEAAVEGVTRASEELDPSAARQQLDLLKMIAPGDPRIPTLELRAEAIAEVKAALEQAAAAALEGDFTGAVRSAETAVDADKDHQGARQLLSGYRQELADARFREAMSDGYFALEEARFDDAKRAFSAAAKIRPGAPEPQAAQAELNNARTAATLRAKQQQGTLLEQQEQWTEAVAAYQSALEIDASVAFARDGLRRALPRKELAERLTAIIEDPDRLVDANALGDASAQLRAAKAVEPRGPVLNKQIDTLESMLEYAQTPVTIKLTSDAATDITLLRVKRLGTLTTTTLTLRPGQYTAMGVRNGYRDVRVNFEVKPGDPTLVDVRCTETI